MGSEIKRKNTTGVPGIGIAVMFWRAYGIRNLAWSVLRSFKAAHESFLRPQLQAVAQDLDHHRTIGPILFSGSGLQNGQKITSRRVCSTGLGPTLVANPLALGGEITGTNPKCLSCSPRLPRTPTLRNACALEKTERSN